MKTRYFLTFAVASLLFYVLGAGCTQDFGAFEACSFGQKPCGNSCVSVADPEFGCGPSACTPCAFANAENLCDKSACAMGSCAAGFENCDLADENGCEADLANDPEQCGSCGTACVTPHAQASCEASKCTIGMCDPGWDDCDGDPATGCEANLDADPAHCGACDIQCPALESCKAGKCVLECEAGKGDCDNDASNGCETDFGTDNDCAFCGDTCDLANASSSCTAGACVIDSCDNGFDDCDTVAANGCEADTDNSAATCGACDNACPNGQNGTTTCNNGTCEIACTTGFGNCDGTLQNGCEADTNASQQNCGGCNQPCTIQNGTGMCTGGTCGVTMCTAPFDDCNNMSGDGCETNTNTSPANCGACGMACSFPNAAASCNGGMCALGACNAGFANCDGMAANGCEKNVGNDPLNCGGCGRACDATDTATVSCAAGVCNSTCDPGFGNCSQPAAPAADNGCETSLATSVDNCGACGRACSGAGVASKSCTAGLCDSSCDPGLGNCSKPAAPMNDNGCEANVTQDDGNCGGCGNSCSLQGGANNDMECDGGNAAQQTCGCSSAEECSGAGVTPGTASCQNGSGLCSCSANVCNVGESCIPAGALSACSCGGAAACTAGQACCQTPAGCSDLQTDPQSCGACGHACSAGFVCNGGGCRCDADADCNAGTGQAFTCNGGTGRCICNGNTCGVGERCLPNGQCG